MPKKVSSASTLADGIRRTIEEEIFVGTLAPGERLDEYSLAQRFKVSRTPIREALYRLSAAGLIAMRPRQGAVVRSITVTQLIEMIQVMAHLEEMCAKLAARRMTEDERNELVKTYKKCQRCVEKGDVEGYYKVSKTFHETIYSGSRNSCLEDMARNLRNRVYPYLREQLRRGNRLAASLAEHEDVLNAIVSGDMDKAGASMRSHVNVQGDVFSDFIASLPRHDALTSG